MILASADVDEIGESDGRGYALLTIVGLAGIALFLGICLLIAYRIYNWVIRLFTKKPVKYDNGLPRFGDYAADGDARVDESD